MLVREKSWSRCRKRRWYHHLHTTAYGIPPLKRLRRVLIFAGLVLFIYGCIYRLTAQQGSILSIGTLPNLRAVELAAAAIAFRPAQKPAVFERDKNAKLYMYADERNDTEFFAGLSSRKSESSTGGKSKKEKVKEDMRMRGLKKTSTSHQEIYSETSLDRKFLPVVTNGRRLYNPSVLPHPSRSDIWIVVGQHQQGGTEVSEAEQLVCAATPLGEALTCTDEPTILKIEPSIEGQCEGKYATYHMHPGPRDARIFHGPDTPMISYGSQSSYACLGVWAQALRNMIDAFKHETSSKEYFPSAKELMRPLPSKTFEKNFFLFWDEDNMPYVHHDIYPSRVFARLNKDGTVGPNLAMEAAAQDNACAARYMPAVNSMAESIHQATNSLLITMCYRSDYDCRPHGGNTFIMTIYHHKTYYDYHSVYEPFVILFRNQAPFATHSIGRKPLWIHGRNSADIETTQVEEARSSKNSGSTTVKNASRMAENNGTDMFYITSMSWKAHGQRYHGYLDDSIFLAFGIEDARAAVMDVNAEDILQNLGLCDSAPLMSS